MRAKNELLKLIVLLLPSKNKLPNTFHQLSSKIQKSLKQINLTSFYCHECNSELVEIYRPCDTCGAYNKKEKLNTFHLVDFKEQVRNVIIANRNSIMEFKASERNFFDLADSEYYDKALTSINLMIYTDGLSFDNSNKKTIWPVIANIIDVPPSLRNSNNCKIICGVWFGEKDPNCQILFEKIYENLKILNEEGLSCNIGLEEWTVFVNVYGFIADAPGKALALNMIRHNGYCSCPYCTIHGNIKNYLIIFNLKI
jgi:hypothetical protein